MATLSNVVIVPVLQTAIGPVILISGIGLLLLTMTNRLARIIDRARAFSAHGSEARDAKRQMALLWKRARLLRIAILLASVSVLCVALLVIFLFATALTNVPMSWLIGGLFIAAMVALIASLWVFIHDVNLSLDALKLELQGYGLSESDRVGQEKV